MLAPSPRPNASYCLHSFIGGYIGDYIMKGRGILGVKTIAHVDSEFGALSCMKLEVPTIGNYLTAMEEFFTDKKNTLQEWKDATEVVSTHAV